MARLNLNVLFRFLILTIYLRPTPYKSDERICKPTIRTRRQVSETLLLMDLSLSKPAHTLLMNLGVKDIVKLLTAACFHLSFLFKIGTEP